MKKGLLIFLFTNCLLATANCQFLQGIGIMGGITYARQKWWTDMPDGSTLIEKHKHLLRFNGEVFLEFIDNPNIRWRTEFQYNQKGTKYIETGDKNKLDYICWNNFIEFRGETYNGYPYFLAGPRVEYLLAQSTPSLPASSATLHFSWSVGVGWEFVAFSNWKPIVELHYNPDFNYAYDTDPIRTKNRAYELRVGFKIDLSSHGSCPKVYK